MDVDKFRRLADFVCLDEYIQSCSSLYSERPLARHVKFFVLYVAWFLCLTQPCTHKLNIFSL